VRCRSYLIRNQIPELILRLGCARNEHDREAEANRESDLATLHTESSLDGASLDVRPKQETRESRSQTALERQFLNPAGNRMLVPRLQAGCQCGVITLHNSCRQGRPFTAIMTIGNIAG
jgi:hypothetical protein